MVRTPCCKEEGIKKGAWTPEEDQKLIAYLQLHGEGGWRTLPQKAGLKRCGKSCRLRWSNYLRPDIKRGEFSSEEDDTIVKLHALYGNKWAAIAASLEGRTDNDIKNYWNTNLKKRLKQKGKGLSPITHQLINSNDQTDLEPKTLKPVGSSGSARLLNRVARKYAVASNRVLLTEIITRNSTIIASDSENAAHVDSSTENSIKKMAAESSALTSIMINSTSPSSVFSENCSFFDDFTDFFSNEEMSDMYKNVESFEFVEEFKGILCYGNAGAGDIY